MTVVDEQLLPVDLEHVRAVALAVIEAEGFPAETEVCVTLVADEEMARHHHEAMGVAGPTDVLAFPLEALEPGHVPILDPNGPPLHLGDILIAPEYVGRQAREYRATFEAEISLLVAHGILHLMGYDHIIDQAAELMEARERAILAGLGLERR